MMTDKTVIPLMWQTLTDESNMARIYALQMLLRNCDANTRPTLEEVENYLIAAYNKRKGDFFDERLALATQKKDVDFLMGYCKPRSSVSKKSRLP